MIEIVQLNSNNRVTLPKSVRQALGLQAKDYIGFEILPDSTVTLSKIGPWTGFSEWESEEDEAAYGNL